MRLHTREKERETEVGGLCEPLPLGTLGLRNNRILVRAASHREDVHRCEKEKRSLYTQTTLFFFTHELCRNPFPRTHGARTAAPNFVTVFAPTFNLTRASKLRQIVRNRRLNTAFKHDGHHYIYIYIYSVTIYSV